MAKKFADLDSDGSPIDGECEFFTCLPGISKRHKNKEGILMRKKRKKGVAEKIASSISCWSLQSTKTCDAESAPMSA